MSRLRLILLIAGLLVFAVLPNFLKSYGIYLMTLLCIYLMAAFGLNLIVGYADGYRASWDAAVGKVTANVFEDNRKAWSGDHCVDPHLVPGVLFSNRKIALADPGLEDMAPTALELFGIKPPPYMEGKSLFGSREQAVESEAAA